MEAVEAELEEVSLRVSNTEGSYVVLYYVVHDYCFSCTYMRYGAMTRGAHLFDMFCVMCVYDNISIFFVQVL